MTHPPMVSGRPLRVAWFSPMPPSASGIAAYSAELVPALGRRGLHVDVFAEPPGASAPGALEAREFVWMQRRAPYDLTVYHMGNAVCHAYMWGYVFRYPGLVVLHDAQVHQARAAALLRRWEPRRADYHAEFVANHPEAPPDLAHLFEAGLGGALYAHWPHIRLLLEGARLSAVHSPAMAARLAAQYGVDVATVPMGVPDPLEPPPAMTPAEVRARHGIPADAYVVGAMGGVTPEKRLPELLRAAATLAASRPDLRLLVVGAPAGHYDVVADARAAGVADRLHVTGFVPDAQLSAYLTAMDVCACMRWPSNGETSASWWRAMAAGRATIITDLPHQPELPVVDPRGWRALGPAAAPIAVAIPILDELACLVSALDTLARAPRVREEMGRAAREYWHAHHTLETMADAYAPLLARAAARPVPAARRPAHLDAAGDERLTSLLAPFGLEAPAGVAPGRA